MNQLEKFNSNYKVQISLAVKWGDMDAFNHVNNAKYFTYFESARIAYFEKLGVKMDNTDAGVAPILAETQCRFKAPLNYPDNILVGARVVEQHKHGFLMEYAIYSSALKMLTSIGSGRIVMLNYTAHKKVEIDAEMLEKINKIENTPILTNQN